MSKRKKTSEPKPTLPADPEESADDGVGTTTRAKSLGPIIIGVVCVIAGAVLIWIGGRYLSKSPTAQVDKARRFLQIERPRLALEALAKEDSAEGHYLKSVALQAIGQPVAAREQIAEALSIDPHDVKYQGYDLNLKVSAGETGAVEELIKLYEVGPSAPGIAFFATNAFTRKKPPEVREALQAFDLGITLIDETPEFMSNAMHFAITTLGQSDPGADEQVRNQKRLGAERLLEKLEQVAPQDVELQQSLLSWAVRGKLVETSERLLKRLTDLKVEGPEITDLKIKVELMLERPESAISIAKQAVSDNPGDPAAELLLAETARQAPPSADHEKILSDLVAKHPQDPEFVAKLALYLGKNKRLNDAVQVVNQSLAVTQGPEARTALLKLAVGIPLEGNDASLSEQQVARFKAEFHNPKLVDYFEGRVLFLKKDFTGAKQKFQKAIENQQLATESDRLLATECLIWQQRILQIELNNAKRAAILEAMKSASTPSGTAAPSPGSEKASEKKNDGAQTNSTKEETKPSQGVSSPSGSTATPSTTPASPKP